jgi:two-component system nitrogen regulation response regulator GlnG
MANILIVDDDQAVATAFERFLKHEGHQCTVVSNAEDGIRMVGEVGPDLVAMDIRMPGVDGLQALQQLRNKHPDVYVVIMTAYGTSQTSIDAIRAGAFEYLRKPFDLDQLRSVIDQAMAAKQSRARADRESEATDVSAPVTLIGESAPMQEVYKLVGRLASHDVPALVVGERGTGKELVIATIHSNSDRRDRRFVSLESSVVTEAVLETELFAADIGTLHLASVHAMARPLQTQLARIMTDDRSRMTARKPMTARVIASTDQDLSELVAADAFSRELYDLLAVITLRLPPLHERRDDIALLVKHFVQRFNEELGRSIKGVNDQVLARLEQHQWPGNVAELESVMMRACIVTRSDVITLEDIGESISDRRFPGRQDLESALTRAVRIALQDRIADRKAGDASSAFHEIVGLVETTLVREALAVTHGNQVKASELLGVNRATLRKKSTGEG